MSTRPETTRLLSTTSPTPTHKLNRTINKSGMSSELTYDNETLIAVHDSDPDDEGGHKLEDVLDTIGTGWFHWKLLLVCGFGNAADAVEIMALSYFLPTTAMCDFELNGNKNAWLNSSLFIGMMIGGTLWGSYSDMAGRKRSLATSLSVNGVAALASACVPVGADYYSLFLMLRLISGIGVGGSIPVLFSYFCEFLPTNKRAMYLVGLAAFWMVGQIIAGAIAWSVIGTVECVMNKSLTQEENCAIFAQQQCERLDIGLEDTVESWRILLVGCAIPGILTAVMIFMLPESPKWLQTVGKDKQAESTIAIMIRANNRCQSRKSKQYVAVQTMLSSGDFRLRSVAHKERRHKERRASCGRKCVDGFRSLGRDFYLVFAGAESRTAKLLMVVWTTLSFGFYGVSLWLPSYYARNDIRTDVIGVYELSFIVAVANVPGNAVAIWTVQSDKIGVRWTLIIALIFSSASIFSIMGVHDFVGTLVSSCFFNAVSVPAWNALNILTTESFKTRHRGTAFGVLASSGRIAAIAGQQVFGQLSEVSDAIPLCIAGAAMATGATATFFLPESRKIVDA